MFCYGICKQCGEQFIKKRNPNQTYCSSSACQNVRKNRWRCLKIRDDIDYKSNQQAAQQRWQSKHLGYWKNYRLNHPEYVKRNREAQRVRDGNVQSKESHLAKSDALLPETLIKQGVYVLAPAEDPLAKSDAFLVKITLISEGCYLTSHLAKRLLYSHASR